MKNKNVFNNTDDLIEYAAEWWANQVLQKKSTMISNIPDPPEKFIDKVHLRIASEVNEESLGKFKKYFIDNAFNAWSDCKHLDMDWSPRCKLLQDCMDAAGLTTLHMPCKCESILDVSRGYFAAKPNYDEPGAKWAIYAKLEGFKADWVIKDLTEEK